MLTNRLFNAAHLFAAAAVALVFCAFGMAAEPVPLSIAHLGLNDLTAETVEDGVEEIVTTGPDPFLYTLPVPEGANLTDTPVLAFEYFSLTGAGEIQVFLAPPEREGFSYHGPELGASQGWSSYRMDLTPPEAWTVDDLGWRQLRIDFGRAAGKTLQIRNMVLRERNAEELEALARAEEAEREAAGKDAALQDYLSRDVHTGLKVTANTETIDVTGFLDATDGTNLDGERWLVEIPVHADVSNMEALNKVERITADWQSEFRFSLPRYGKDGRDRLFSRWGVRVVPNRFGELISFGTYASEVEARSGLKEVKPRNRKGLGAFSPGRPVEDVEALDVSAVTVNVILSSLLHTEDGDGRTPYEYAGRTWYANDGAVAQLDATMRGAAEYGVVVSAIILIPQGKDAPEGSFRRMIAHPDADPAGIYVMPNLTSAESVAAYTATLNFLAERYSRPDGEFGRIHHWIMHNEVNSGWVWTNMGEKSAIQYMDAYHKSMRLMQLIAWQYDPYAMVYISLEHHWDSVYAPHCYKGKEMLELLVEFSRAEGDFPWAIAYHPYPENLRDPRAWEDETAWFSFDTPRITFHNIEVLDAWVKRGENRYQGETIRDIQFTEQGPNSPDYSEESLRDQAASMAYVWKKMEALDTVSMFQFHNWVDNRHEGGLRIGLRRYPDDGEDPLGKKPVWHVFQALGTEQQAGAIDFAKKVIGIEGWDEVVYKGEIPETRGE